MGGDPTIPATAFAHSLGRLQGTGAVLLVVGDVGSTGHRRAFRAFATTSPEAWVMRVETDGFCHAEAGPSRERWGGPVIAYTSPRRAGSATTPGPGANEPRTPAAFCSTPSELAEAVERAIDGRRGSSPDGSAVRLCLDSLGPLLADHPGEAVREALDRIRDAIAAVGGLAHAHLPVARDHAAVPQIAPACRCVIELDRTAEGLRHRWHFEEHDTSTEWYPLPRSGTVDP